MLPKFTHLHNKTANIDVLLHGSSAGYDSSFISKIFDRSKKAGHSVLAFNFPYIDRGDQSFSGEELIEEQAALMMMLNYLAPFNYKKVRFIAKSLGGVVLAKCLAKIAELSFETEVVIMGYVVGSVDLTNYTGNITVVQGSQDKFGSSDAVQQDLTNQGLANFKIVTIQGADHSYRVPNTKDEKYVDQAVDAVFN